MRRTARRALLATVLLPLVAGGAVGVAGCGDDDRVGAAAPAGDPGVEGRASAVDAAFVRQMIPHHEMAVEMASLALDRSRDERVRKLATGIVDAQTDELEELGDLAEELSITLPAGSTAGAEETTPPAGAEHEGMEGMDHGGDAGGMEGMDHGSPEAAADAKTLGLAETELGMSMDMGALRTADPFDRAFAEAMLEHHRGAIAMAEAQGSRGANAELGALAGDIVTVQRKEAGELEAIAGG